MNDKAMVALCRECRGLHAATVMDQTRPYEWTKEVAKWTKWKSAPLIEQTTIELVRKSGGFCHALGKGGEHAKEPFNEAL